MKKLLILFFLLFGTANISANTNLDEAKLHAVLGVISNFILSDTATLSQASFLSDVPSITTQSTLSIDIAGEVGASVYLNGSLLGVIDSNGEYSIPLTFTDGDNTFEIILEDSKGLRSEGLTFTIQLVDSIGGTVGDDPISGGTVKVFSLAHEEIYSTTTDENGNFSLSVLEEIGHEFILEATGGTMNGLDFNATLRSLYSVDDNLDTLNLTSITTLVAQSAMDNNTPSIAKREQSLQQMVNMGMLKKEDWFERDPSFVNMNELDAWQGDEVDIWVDKIILDVTDSQLGRDKMSVFSMAHGGVANILAY
ncbi:MAG: carboxypeptidase-like regulatory domain-containing protein [Sulfurovum sp.]|nr:carboxypeptidase-like regulatory domain-containing protein [Sulfurovum sp.]